MTDLISEKWMAQQRFGFGYTDWRSVFDQESPQAYKKRTCDWCKSSIDHSHGNCKNCGAPCDDRP